MTNSELPSTVPPPPTQKSNKWILWVIGIIAGCLVLTCCIALIVLIVLFAQGTLNIPGLGGPNQDATTSNNPENLSGDVSLNPGGTPTYGEETLASGFSPDPFLVPVTSGGSVDVAAQVGMDCTGYTASSPDFRLTFSGSASILRFFFVANAGDDTTLVINDPSGSWYCNDDASSGGWDPMVDFTDPLPGVYDVWVGSYTSASFVGGTLFITELNFTPQEYQGTTTSLDYNLDPTYGTQDLGGTGNPDTYELTMEAGGSTDVGAMSLGDDCVGFAAAFPDFEINYQGSASRLRFFFVAEDGSDTTLIINKVDTTWACNDNFSSGLDPMVEITDPDQGTYDIWVGTLYGAGFINGTLYVTEGNYQPGRLPY